MTHDLKHRKPSLSEVLSCLERSGYLLESRLVRQLVDDGYFVEPNQAVLDPRTGKSREIDLLAQHFDGTAPIYSVTVKTHFVIEVCNNKLPVVLLTERPDSPVLAAYESYLKFGCSPEPFPYHSDLDCFQDRLETAGSLFSQFCGISEKKSGHPGELMAGHPDDLYGSLLKLSEYVDDEVEHWHQPEGLSQSKSNRVFFWHPMLALGGDLLVTRVDRDGQAHLEERESAFLEFNRHTDEGLRTALIEFVTATAMRRRLAEIVAYDRVLELRAHQLVGRHG